MRDIKTKHKSTNNLFQPSEKLEKSPYTTNIGLIWELMSAGNVYLSNKVNIVSRSDR
jgi:hypothetical protein